MPSTSENPPTVARKVPTWSEWDDKREQARGRFNGTFGAERVARVDELYVQAMGYAWGWQDAKGREARDSGDAVDFARAYGFYAAEYECGERSSRRPIQDAWQAWLRFGDVTAPLSSFDRP